MGNVEYMSAREAADKWGVSQRRVAVLCAEHRIDNATMVGNMWIIPTTAQKPVGFGLCKFHFRY